MAALCRTDQQPPRCPEAILRPFEGVEVHQPIDRIFHPSDSDRLNQTTQGLRKRRMSCGRERSQTMDAKRGEVLAAVCFRLKVRAVTGLLVNRDGIPVVSTEGSKPIFGLSESSPAELSCDDL
jgi:hypothetical protein